MYASHALLDAALQLQADAMCPDSQRVRRNPEAQGQISPDFNSGLFFFLVVLHNQLKIFRRQFSQTALQTILPKILIW